MNVSVLIFELLYHVVSVLAVRKSLPASSARGSHVIHQRSNAITGQTVFLKTGEYLYFNLCLRKDATILVSDVRYSNDGGPDVVSIIIDKVDIGSFQTGNDSDWGRLWNLFHLSGPVGKRWVFREGWHELFLVSKATNGIEIDYIELELSDETITRDILTCALMCTNTSPKVPPVNQNVVEKATMLQSSYATKCAEEDNVKLPVFLKNVLAYRITATLPKYRTFINKRHPNTTGCPFLPSVYWKVSNLIIPQTLSRTSFRGVAVDFLFGYNRPHISQVLQVTFRLKGRTEGYIDADIGSKVTIQILPVKGTVTMRVLYRGRTKKIIGLNDQIFNPGDTIKEWHVPDFSWIEYDDNVLFVSIACSSGVDSLTVEYVELERRYMRPDRVFTISSSDNIVIEGIDVDFWWRAPETMEVRRMDNGNVFKKVDYFRISRTVPWSTGYAQIFVLYQDGNARLLELPPQGLDWIPFGTSVIIGQSDTNVLRPSAPIVRMDLHPAILNMTLYYADGGSANLNLRTSLRETVLDVSGLTFKKPLAQYPFATFRSMYVKDGNCDSDSVLVDGKDVHEVARGWNTLHGKSFMLFRRCESKHLTLSPDIRLDIQQTTSSPSSLAEDARIWAQFVNWKRLMGQQ